MKFHERIHILLLGALLVALSGCATYPVSTNLRKQAKPVALAMVSADPGAYKGTVVIWGGKVINTVNDTNGGVIYVLRLPLTRRERPERQAASSGRFIARSNGFIDPEVFKNGRLITVAGEIVGLQTEPLQKAQYPYPVVAIKELHLWHRVRSPHYPYYYPGSDGGWYGPGWGWYGPGWGWAWGYPDWGW